MLLFPWSLFLDAAKEGPVLRIAGFGIALIGWLRIRHSARSELRNHSGDANRKNSPPNQPPDDDPASEAPAPLNGD